MKTRSSTLLACALFLAAMPAVSPTASAQTPVILHAFTGGTTDGAAPWAGLTPGPGGVFYGTTSGGGASKHGTVFSLTPPTTQGGAWTEAILYSFLGGSDGAIPNYGSLAFGAGGVLYGTTESGGTANVGVVFGLAPPTTQGGAWTEAVLHTFTGGTTDGATPFASVIGSAGILYGTTSGGGAFGSGTVYSLTPPPEQGGVWTETVIYSFAGFTDGASPFGGLVADSNGVLYGATTYGGAANDGTVFSLTPGSGTWTKASLYSFGGGGDANWPASALVLGTDGTLYGSAQAGGASGRGAIFSLAPPASQGAAWTESVLYSFTGLADGSTPYAGLALTSSGMLYGTTEFGGSKGDGAVFSLTPPIGSGGSWTEATIYSFTGMNDGGFPLSSLSIDSSGALYGTTCCAGSGKNGTAFQFQGTTYTISGQVTLSGSGFSGVTVTLSGSQSGSTVTDSTGNYWFTVAGAGNYTVTPSLTGYTFTPTSQTFNNISANQTANFTATPALTISGQVTLNGSGLSGVTMSLTGSQTGSATTDSSGNYTFTVTSGGNYSVTPSLSGYTFNPPNASFTNLTTSQVANFTATGTTFTISGQVTLLGSGLAGVTMTLSGSQSSTTTTAAMGTTVSPWRPAAAIPLHRPSPRTASLRRTRRSTPSAPTRLPVSPSTRTPYPDK